MGVNNNGQQPGPYAAQPPAMGGPQPTALPGPLAASPSQDALGAAMRSGTFQMPQRPPMPGVTAPPAMPQQNPGASQLAGALMGARGQPQMMPRPVDPRFGRTMMPQVPGAAPPQQTIRPFG